VDLKREDTVAPPALPRDCACFIQKLRWIGLDEEARCLESALSRLPPEERCALSFEPGETD
jgi:hypothetical protein